MPMRRRVGSALVAITICVLAACGGGGGSKAAPASSNSASGFGAPATGAEAGATYVPTGPLIADDGFRPEKDGFGFENYGASDNKNLTPVEMRRLFGDQVCATMQGGDCLLTPPAQQWMDEKNSSMSGGHCFGFSVAALEMFTGKVPPTTFGADATVALPLPNNDALQREIAYSFVYQYLDNVRAGMVSGTPADVLDKLIASLQAPKGTGETYTIGFFQADGQGGHAVTPYAVEDKGDNKFAVLVYDNNYPNITRAIQFDKTANTWSYEAAINPSEPTSAYKGDANTQSFFLFPSSPGTAQQPCPFCAPAGNGTSLGRPGASPMPISLANRAQADTAPSNEVTLEGSPGNHGHLIITDDQGRRAGIIDGKRVSEIPGVTTVDNFASTNTWDMAEEPVYDIPLNVNFTITVDGSPLKETDKTNVLLIGPGYDLVLDGINLDPGQKDTLTLSPDGTHLSYTTTQSESPTIAIGRDGTDADHAFALQGVDVPGGGTIDATIDPNAGTIRLTTKNTTAAGQYLMLLDRFTATSEQVFKHDNIELQPGDVAVLNFGSFKQDGDAVTLTVSGPNGEDANTIQLTDEGN